jgi:Ca2+-binding EF-hand superfamily protein
MGNKVNGNGVGRRESLRKKDLETLMQHFQLDKETISIIVNHFEMQTDLEMDKAEFLALYSKITHTDSNNEGFKLLSDKIFDIFDADNSGTVSFHEFLV